MLYRDICKILGLYLYGFTIALLVPLLLEGYYLYFGNTLDHPQPHAVGAFVKSIAISLLLAISLTWIGRHTSGNLYRRESLVTVVIIWFLTPALGGLPFYLSGTLNNPYQAYFEAASGLTTTGSSVMQAKSYNPATGKEQKIEVEVCGALPTKYSFYGTIDPIRDPQTQKVLYEGVEAVGKPLLFWRSFLQWLGGVGIVVLFVAVLPALGVGGKMLFHSEVTGPVKDSLTPRIKESALQLWKIYLGLTAAQFSLLMLTNHKMEWLDAITITFSTLSTGGFSIRNSSIAYYHNTHTEWIVILFMILGSINFSLYFYFLRGKFYRIYEPEFLLYMVILLIGCGISSWLLIGGQKVLLSGEPAGIFTVNEAIRHGVFQIVSAETSTGFATVDYDKWPYLIQVLMLIVMYVGGMSGSTSGGIKIIRHYMLFRIAQFKVETLFRPETVRKFKVGDRDVDAGASILVLCFFLVIVTVSTIGTILYIADGIDPETALGCVACTINNVGLAFRVAGPTESFAFMSDFSLVLSSILMILGRLEFFTILAILVPAFWKQNS